ncbi:MAG: PRC-barrel domain containing protein, partial [Cyanobacteria bacterium J06555_13]
PVEQTITHLAITADEGLGDAGRIVPFEQILETTPTSIQLRCHRTDLLKMDVFIKKHYIPNALLDSALDGVPRLMRSHSLDLTNPDTYRLWPYTIADTESPYFPIEEEQIPMGDMAVRRGAQVRATDSVVGDVDEFVVDLTNGHITHLITREGHLGGPQEIALPLSVIENMANSKIFQPGVNSVPS